jgi:hypothetical protein
MYLCLSSAFARNSELKFGKNLSRDEKILNPGPAFE